jgi:hypothetical protein
MLVYRATFSATALVAATELNDVLGSVVVAVGAMIGSRLEPAC